MFASPHRFPLRKWRRLVLSWHHIRVGCDSFLRLHRSYQASRDDLVVYAALPKAPDAKSTPHAARWYSHIKALLGAR